MDRTRARGRYMIGSSDFNPELIIVDFLKKTFNLFVSFPCSAITNKINVV